jgi:hypothetical protein
VLAQRAKGEGSGGGSQAPGDLSGQRHEMEYYQPSSKIPKLGIVPSPGQSRQSLPRRSTRDHRSSVGAQSLSNGIRSPFHNSPLTSALQPPEGRSCELPWCMTMPWMIVWRMRATSEWPSARSRDTETCVGATVAVAPTDPSATRYLSVFFFFIFLPFAFPDPG